MHDIALYDVLIEEKITRNEFFQNICIDIWGIERTKNY